MPGYDWKSNKNLKWFQDLTFWDIEKKKPSLLARAVEQ